MNGICASPGRFGGSPRLLVLVVMIVTTLVVVGGLVLTPPANGSAATFKQIAAECGASVDRSGAGRAVLSRSTALQNVSGNLPVPCRLYLEQGASLTIADSHLTTQTLTITNEPIQDSSAIFHSNVTIEHSYLFGEGNSGLTVALGSAADTLTISDSRIYYPQGVIADVGAYGLVGLGAGGGHIDVRRSLIHAVSQTSLGIHLVTSVPGGVTSLVDDDLQATWDIVRIYGPTCSAQRVAGLLPDCHPEPALLPMPSPPTSGRNQSFVTGSAEVFWFANNCRINVSFAASSDPDGSSASGTITMAAVPGPNCSGQLTGSVTCLIINGNHAVFGGVVTQATDIFDMGNLVFGTATENPSRQDGGPADQAYFGMAGAPAGVKTCPPPLGPGNGPTVLGGSVRVHQAG